MPPFCNFTKVCLADGHSMADRVACRTNFFESSKTSFWQNEHEVSSRTRKEYRVRHQNDSFSSRGVRLQNENSNPRAEVNADIFMFTTPGRTGAKAVRSVKKQGCQNDQTKSLPEGSPMIWSPAGSPENDSNQQPFSFASVSQTHSEEAGSAAQHSSSQQSFKLSAERGVSKDLGTGKSAVYSSDSMPRVREDNDGLLKGQPPEALSEQLQRRLHIDEPAGICSDAPSRGSFAVHARSAPYTESTKGHSSSGCSAGFIFSAQLAASPTDKAQRARRSGKLTRSCENTLAAGLFAHLRADEAVTKPQGCDFSISDQRSTQHHQQTHTTVSSSDQPSSTGSKISSANKDRVADASGAAIKPSLPVEPRPAAALMKEFDSFTPKSNCEISSFAYQQRAFNSDTSPLFAFGDKRVPEGEALEGNSGQEQQQDCIAKRVNFKTLARRRRQKSVSKFSHRLQESAPAGVGRNATAEEPVVASLVQEIAASKSCEMYRNQGNEAFRKHDYHGAYNYYTKAIQSLSPWPTLHSRMAVLMSNRAAALLSLGKPFLALKDCQTGLSVDPQYTRCALRIATCHYRLGNFTAALEHLEGMMHQATGNRKLLADVDKKLDEVRKHQRHVELVLCKLGYKENEEISGCRRNGGSEQDILDAMADLDAILAHVPHADYLHAAKVQALLCLGRYAQALAGCDMAIHHDESQQHSTKRPWQLWLAAQSYYHEGNYPEALQSLKALSEACRVKSSAKQAGVSMWLDAVVSLPSEKELTDVIAAIESAQSLRQAGNNLMKKGMYKEAANKYTEALAVPRLSAAFASILYSNRAAALQGSSLWLQAVADCCRSKALVPSYAKAQSRLASLLTKLRMHTAAVQALESALQTRALPNDDRHAYEQRLQEIKRVSKRAAEIRWMKRDSSDIQPDYYSLLMLDRKCTPEEVRKAYKRLALQLHPDKVVSACRFTSQLSESGTKVLPVLQASDRLQQDAKWLFQCLGDAHQVLLDETKRQALDHDLRLDDICGSFASIRSFGRRY